jgi:hypothetical protein
VRDVIAHRLRFVFAAAFARQLQRRRTPYVGRGRPAEFQNEVWGTGSCTSNEENEGGGLVRLLKPSILANFTTIAGRQLQVPADAATTTPPACHHELAGNLNNHTLQQAALCSSSNHKYIPTVQQ